MFAWFRMKAKAQKLQILVCQGVSITKRWRKEASECGKQSCFRRYFLTEKYEDIDGSISNICHIFEYPQIFTRWEYCSHIVNVYGQGDGGIKQTKVSKLSTFASNMTAFTNNEQIWEDGCVANIFFLFEKVEKGAGNRFKYFIVPNLLLSWTRTALGRFCKGL